jgi:hypothetical protein
VKFYAVLRLVPSLFRVKYLETNNVPRFHVSFACAYKERPGSPISCAKREDMEHVEHVEQTIFFSTLRRSMSSNTWNKCGTSLHPYWKAGLCSARP